MSSTPSLHHNLIPFRLLGLVGLVLASPWVFAASETYLIDTAHSSVQFRIGHNLVSKVTGRFKTFEGALTVDRDAWEKSSVKATIETRSVDTNHAERDGHLQGEDFFDAPKYPKITFESKTWKKVGENEFEVTGDLILHGVTKSVTLKAKSLGFGEGRTGSHLSGWEIRGKIKRSDFGMKYGAPLVADEVEIEIDIEAKRQ